MSKHCFNSISFREGIASDEVGTCKPYMHTRRKVTFRRHPGGYTWTVIDDFGGVYGSGRCTTKKEGKQVSRQIVRPPKTATAAAV